MAFLKKFKKLTALFKKLFSHPRRRRKSPARKSKKKIIQKSALRRSPKIKKLSGEKSRNFKPPPSLPIGEITHFFPRIQVCVLKVSASGIKVGDQILILRRPSNRRVDIGRSVSTLSHPPAFRPGLVEGLIAGKERRFTQKVASLQIESVDVKRAKRGDLVGLKLDKPAVEGDKVFFAKRLGL